MTSQYARTERKLPSCDAESMPEVLVFFPLFVLSFVVGRLSGFVFCLVWLSMVGLLRPEIVLLGFYSVLAVEVCSLSV